MARRLIFASVPVGLVPGRSGYCTVAKSPGLPERLVRDLERVSAHEPGEGLAFTYRRFTYGDSRYGVLTRYVDAGADYTGRASTLADHLVFTDEELRALPPPADLARRFTGWTAAIPAEPAALSDAVALPLAGNPVALPAATWKRVTGDAGKAALFCDDAGQARAGTFPASDPDTTLALLAEAALLTADHGRETPFDTREHAVENGMIWKCATTLAPATLPEPGVAPRAVLARGGALPGARPGTTGTARARIEYQTETPRKKPGALPLVAGVGAVALLAAGVAALALRRPDVETSPEIADATPASPARPVVVASDPPLLIEALAAMSRGDLLAAAELRMRLSREHPEDDARAYPKLLYPLRDRLFAETLARHARATNDPDHPLDANALDRIEKEITRAEKLAEELGAPPRGTEVDAARRLRADLAALRAAAHAIPEGLVAVRTGDTAEDVSVYDLGEVPALAELLSLPDARFTAALFACDSWREPGAPFVQTEVPARDYAAGKILAITLPESRALVEFRLDARKRVTLRIKHPQDLPAAFASLKPGRSTGIRLTDTQSGATRTLFLVDEAAPPAPARLPLSLLTLKDGAVAPKSGLAEATARLTALGGKHALSPAGYEGSLRDHSGTTADRSVIERALGHPNFASKAETLRARLRAADPAALDMLAPWRLEMSVPGGKHPLILVIFERP